MTAKEYLSQVRYLDNQIDAKLERVTRLRALAERRTAAYGEHIRGGGSDRYDVVLRIAEAEAELDRQIDRLIDLKAEIHNVIQAVQDDRYRTLLELRYLAGYSWQRVADAMRYERRQVFRLHGAALLEVEKSCRTMSLQTGV